MNLMSINKNNDSNKNYRSFISVTHFNSVYNKIKLNDIKIYLTEKALGLALKYLRANRFLFPDNQSIN